MPYDPNWPPTNAELISADFRNQFQGLKALIDALQAQVNGLQTQVNGLLPVGIIVGWDKDRVNMPALPGTWVECNGQVLNDPLSPFHGQTMRNLNGANGEPRRFLRGGLTSGETGGSDSHAHALQALDGDHGNYTSVSNSTNDVTVLVPGTYTTQDADSLPPYCLVVWVMRIK